MCHLHAGLAGIPSAKDAESGRIPRRCLKASTGSQAKSDRVGVQFIQAVSGRAIPEAAIINPKL